MSSELVKCAFNQYARKSKCIGWCRKHNCYLTLNNVKNMKCIQKKCFHLIRLDRQFWRDLDKKRADKRSKKNGTNESI